DFCTSLPAARLNMLADWSTPRGRLRHVAWVYLTESSSTNEAACKMRATLRRFASSLGHLEKYHETITLFWVHFLARERAMAADKSLEQIVKANRQLLEKDFPLTYYSRQLLFSDRARESWVEPDLKHFLKDVF